MSRRVRPQEDVPMGILQGPSRSRNEARHVQEVRMDLGDLPSNTYNPEGSDITQRSSRRRSRLWAQNRSRDATNAMLNLPSHSAGLQSVGDESASLFSEDQSDGPVHGVQQRAAQIVSEMGRDSAFMDDNPLAEQLRMETLREMPESLTIKRTIRRELGNSVSRKSKRTKIGLWKRMKYSVSICIGKTSVGIKDLTTGFEPWYQSLKIIEGHFGSGVATYFKYLRWLLLLNVVVCIVSLSFIVLPQLLYRFYEPAVVDVTEDPGKRLLVLYDENDTGHGRVAITPIPDATDTVEFNLRLNPYRANAAFSFSDIFTGEGFFTDTTLYYGYYANDSLHMTASLRYSIPNAYFFTAFASYVFTFIVVSISMARSYRVSFIQTAGGLKDVYAHKIFCGWDFSIATDEAAKLKSRSIANELKELLNEEAMSTTDRRTLAQRCCKLLTQLAANVLCVALVAAAAYLMWTLLKLKHTMLVSAVITVVLIVAPIFFSWLLRYEGYRQPRTALYVTLFRTFVLEVVVVAMLIAYWLTEAGKTECWETGLAQEVYRLILMDFWLAVVFTSVAEFIRSRLHKSVWPGVGAPEFHIARNTLSLIYNQTLFWAGGFFSPLLSLIVVAKMFVTFHAKRVGVLANCRPSERPWRAAQTQTVFLVLSFLSLVGVVATYGYILTQVRPSETCGPFRNYTYIYEMVLINGLNQEKDNAFWKLILFLTKPGVVGGLLLALGVWVYYLRARALGQRHLVEILREMLLIEAKDKEFLLGNISKVTEGQWMYNLREGDVGMRRTYQQDQRGSPSRLHGSKQPQHGSAPNLRGSKENLHGSAQNQHGLKQRLHGSPQHLHSPKPSTSAGGDYPRSAQSLLASRSTTSSGAWPSSSDTSGPAMQMSSEDSSHGYLSRRMMHYPGTGSNYTVLSSSVGDMSNYAPSDTDDQIVEQSDDDSNDYEGAKIRNMRLKHIKKY